MAGLVGLGVWALAAVLTVAMPIAVQRSRAAAVVGLIAVLGFATVVVVDIDLGYPYAYYRQHRSDFAAAAAFADSIPVDHEGYGEAWLPDDHRDLAGGHISVGPSPNGLRTAVLWMSVSSGIGYGYAYAPSARHADDAGLTRPAAVAAEMALGDGWWWVSNV